MKVPLWSSHGDPLSCSSRGWIQKLNVLGGGAVVAREEVDAGDGVVHFHGESVRSPHREARDDQNELGAKSWVDLCGCFRKSVDSFSNIEQNQLPGTTSNDAVWRSGSRNLGVKLNVACQINAVVMGQNLIPNNIVNP